MPSIELQALTSLELVGLSIFTTIASSGLVILILRTYLAERIKRSVQSGYDESLEKLKAELKWEFDHEIETHKAQLKRDGDLEIEQLKSRLNIAAAQQQLQFAKLHERRAVTITEIYAALQTFRVAVSEYTAIFEPAGMPPRAERRKAAVDAGNAFIRLLLERQIFLPQTTAQKLSEIRDEYRSAMIDFQFNVDIAEGAGQKSTKAWLAITDKIKNLSDNALVELEHDFRRLLGDDGPKP